MNEIESVIHQLLNTRLESLCPIYQFAHSDQLPQVLSHFGLWVRCGMSIRYAPATQLWNGRLHVLGGSKEDRQQPASEHWSIAVRDGKALEAEWREEVPIPRGGPHR